jgi:periplasmic protein TonB
VGRLNQRQGFLVSAIVHLAILMTLASRPPGASRPEPQPQASSPPPRAALIMPDRELLRQYLKPHPAVPKAVPAPAPTPPPPSPDRKERISIGAPSDVRQKQLLLRRDEDLVVPKGRPDAAPSVKPPESPVPPSLSEEGTRTARSSEPVIGGQAPPVAPGRETPSIAGSLRNLERRMQASGPRGLPTGTGQQMGPLFFDPEGADFTGWLNHFKNEVYRNWIVPQPALMGFRGHVDIEFVVERDGRISSLRILKSTGTPALDRAAQNALLGSRFLPLPADFAPPRITMQGGFYYNEGPQGS